MTLSYSLSCSESQNTIVLTDQQYLSLKRAKKCVAAYQAIECKFNMVMANYQVLEQAIKNAEIELNREQHCYHASLPSFTIADALNNYILAVKLFTTQIIRHVQMCIPRERENVNLIKQTLNDMNSHCFGYRLVDSLHDYLLLRGSIAHCLLVLPVNKQGDTQIKGNDFRVRGVLRKDMISGAQEFRQSVYDELSPQHDISEVAQSCNTALLQLKITAFSVIHHTTAKAMRKINEASVAFSATFGQLAAEIYLTQIDSVNDTKIIDRQLLFPHLASLRFSAAAAKPDSRPPLL